MNLFEKVKKFFLQTEEPESTSTTPKQKIEEPGEKRNSSYVNYDPFNSYTSQSIFGDSKDEILNKYTIQKMNQSIIEWRILALCPEIEEAIEEIIDETIPYDEIQQTIKINVDNIELPKRVKHKIIEKFEKIYNLLDIDERGDEIFRQFYVDGQLNVEPVYDKNTLSKGIQKIQFLTPFNLIEYKDKKTNRKYYTYTDVKNLKDEELYKLDKLKFMYTEEDLIRITSGIWNLYKSYPLSYLYKVQKVLNQLNLIEDSIIIYRLTRSPEKYVFNIDVGRLPKHKAEEYIQQLMMKFRQKKVYNLEKGTLEGKTRKLSMLEDFWFSRTSDGHGSSVDVLSTGVPDISEIEDLKYFLKKLYRSLNVPLTRIFTPEEARIVFGSNEYEREEIKFFKFITKLRRRFNHLFLELLRRELVSCKIMKDEEFKNIQKNIKFIYANDNQYYEMKELTILDTRLSTASSATALVDDGYLSKKYIQKNILFLSDEEINEIEQENSEEETKQEETNEENF